VGNYYVKCLVIISSGESFIACGLYDDLNGLQVYLNQINDALNIYVDTSSKENNRS
jgi:hypothetical protein